MYHLVDVIASDDQTFEDVGTLLRLLQVKLCTTDGNIMTMLHEVLHALLQGEQARTTIHQGDAVDRERTLQCSHLEELVQEHIGIGITLHIHYDTHTLATRLIVHIGNAIYLAFLGEVGDSHDELLLVDTVRNLSDDNLVVSIPTLDLGSSTYHDTTTTGLVSVLHTLDTIDGSTCREVWSRNIFHQAIGVDVRIVDVSTAAIDDLTQVVGRNIGSHTHGDTVTTIHQEVRNLGRHHGRFLEGVIEVVHHIDGFLVQVVHDVLTHLREAALSITHGSRRVAIDRTEVTLSINQCVTHVPLLSHAHEGTIDRGVAVWVILTEHLTYYARTFLIRFVTGVSNTEHTIENTAVHRLETITYIWEGTSHNHRHGIVDVG